MLLVLLEQPWPTRESRRQQSSLTMRRKDGTLRFPKDWSSFTTITYSVGIGWVDYSVALKRSWNSQYFLCPSYPFYVAQCHYILYRVVSHCQQDPQCPILSPLTFIYYWSLTHRQYHFSGLSDHAARHPWHAHVFGSWVVKTLAGPHTQLCMNECVSSDRLCGLFNAPFHGHVAMWQGCRLGCSLVTFAHLTQDYIECICTYSISTCSNIFNIMICAYHGICSPFNALSNIHVIVLQGHWLSCSQTAFVHATQDNVCHSSTFQRCLV